MPTTPQSQASLAADPDFIRRLSGLLLSEAMVVALEPPAVPDLRRQLAQRIIQQPQYQTQSLAPAICNATNLVAANTSYDFASATTVTDADDAAIRSQIASLWNTLAGV
jgi:hypothetical protein